MKVYEASTRISAEFGGIRDLSRHLSLNSYWPVIRVLRLAFCPQAPHLASIYLAQINFARVRPALQKRDSRQRGNRE